MKPGYERPQTAHRVDHSRETKSRIYARCKLSTNSLHDALQQMVRVKRFKPLTQRNWNAGPPRAS